MTVNTSQVELYTKTARTRRNHNLGFAKASTPSQARDPQQCSVAQWTAPQRKSSILPLTMPYSSLSTVVKSQRVSSFAVR
ncbi:hypothetical protein BO99DRAFT_114348 [Aspergillus violaceofuscus CBS 115571]|uniref:Uncharacterized protein n=1 Tax=Aspergillus violaceofuscus (strain CBS 115571) TaxID=1450538 RepID=A0A2V5H7Z2_ASPV1|nr:hypothetical protein BO99DRAFT_114348 [Aspergillus violaceofuscus CBS 115571]